MKRIRRLMFAAISTFVVCTATAQICTGEMPVSLSYSSIDHQHLDALTYNDTINYSEIDHECDSCAQFCGINIPVSIDFFSSATRVYSDAENEIWILRVRIPAARSIGIYFKDFKVPAGYKLFAYDVDFHDVVGSIEGNEQPEGVSQFAIRAVSGNQVFLELVKPRTVTASASLIIEGFGLFAFDDQNQQNYFVSKSSESTGSCYVDVFCSPFTSRDRPRGVLRWYFKDTQDNKFYTCTGSLMNQNVEWNNLKPIFYTANHCGKNAQLSTIIFYFNYQRPGCNTGNVFTSYSLVGAWKKAQKTISDMYLMQLYQVPPPHYNARYLGYHKDSNVGHFDDVESIHHPEGLRKSYSEGTITGLVHPWKYGVAYFPNSTADVAYKGSSGCPLFLDGTSLVVGNLSWGIASCNYKDGNDHYSKLKKHWDDNGGSGERLKDWLDPYGYNNDQVDARDPCYDNLTLPYVTYHPGSYYQPSNKVMIQAGNSISTGNNYVLIQSGAEYVFTAGTQVHLAPGFSAVNGSKFSSYVAGCTGVGTAHRIADLSEENEEPVVIERKPSLKLSGPENDLIIFPNPVRDELQIKVVSEENDMGKLSISDCSGRIVAELFVAREINAGGNSFVFSNIKLANGIYFCEYSSASFSQREKIVVMK